MQDEIIMMAAIHYRDGKEHAHQPKNIESGYVICGLRHNNCIGIHTALTGKRTATQDYIDGFVTNKNRFVDRKEGLKIATESGQIQNKTTYEYELFSEDLW